MDIPANALLTVSVPYQDATRRKSINTMENVIMDIPMVRKSIVSGSETRFQAGRGGGGKGEVTVVLIRVALVMVSLQSSNTLTKTAVQDQS